MRGSSCGVGAAYGAVIGAAALGTIAGVYGPMENRDAKSTAGAALGGALWAPVSAQWWAPASDW